MAPPVKKERKAHWTYTDYLAWDGYGYIEIINGEVYQMPQPSRLHQKVDGELARQFGNFLEGKPYQAYACLFTVRPFEKAGDSAGDVDTVVMPDLTVVCDLDKLDDMGCKGAPDMVIEILSPSNRRHDRLVKLNLYQRAGVPEYWIVDPEGQSVQVFLLDDNGTYRIHEDYGRNDIAKVHTLEGCFIELCKVFPA